MMTQWFAKWLFCFLLASVIALPVLAGADTAPQWSHYGATAGGSGFSPLTQINTDNVSELKEAWRIRTGDSERFGALMERTSTEVTPILLPQEAGGHLAFCTPFNRIVALNPATGEQQWSYDPKIDLRGNRAFRCRGVAYWVDSESPATADCTHRVISASHDRRLIAVDARTGKACQEFGEQGQVRLYSDSQGYVPDDISSSSAPVVINDVVITGSAVIDFERARAPQGEVKAYSAVRGNFYGFFIQFLAMRVARLPIIGHTMLRRKPGVLMPGRHYRSMKSGAWCLCLLAAHPPIILVDCAQGIIAMLTRLLP